jgi:hypothetical protein
MRQFAESQDMKSGGSEGDDDCVAIYAELRPIPAINH